MTKKEREKEVKNVAARLGGTTTQVRNAAIELGLPLLTMESISATENPRLAKAIRRKRAREAAREALEAL